MPCIPWKHELTVSAPTLKVSINPRMQWRQQLRPPTNGAREVARRLKQRGLPTR